MKLFVTDVSSLLGASTTFRAFEDDEVVGVVKAGDDKFGLV